MALRWDHSVFQQHPTPPRCERKRLYPMGDHRDQCLNPATHLLVTVGGRKQHACAVCVGVFVNHMVKGEEIHVVRI